jgi:tRNA(Ile)-lysidine synthase
MLNINSFLGKYISENEKIILACSTWPDSIFLLHKILESPYKNNLIVCYFNHHLREEAKEEEDFITELSKKYNFQLELWEAHIENMRLLSKSVSLEELARKERYEFLHQIRGKYNALYILTAHHLDDKIETFLFNLLRGSKLTGLINMTEFSGNILRPLLYLEKKEILNSLEERWITYKLDSSNTDKTITRNFLREDIIPLFQAINPKYKENIANTLSYFEELKENIDAQIQKFLIHDHFFYVDEFLELSEFLQREIIRDVFWKTNNFSTIWLSEANIHEVIKFIKNKGNYTKKHIKNMSLTKQNNIIKFSHISRK